MNIYMYNTYKYIFNYFSFCAYFPHFYIRENARWGKCRNLDVLRGIYIHVWCDQNKWQDADELTNGSQTTLCKSCILYSNSSIHAQQ